MQERQDPTLEGRYQGALAFITDIKELWFDHTLDLIDLHSGHGKRMSLLTMHRRNITIPEQKEAVISHVTNLINTVIDSPLRRHDFKREATRTTVMEQYGIATGIPKPLTHIRRDEGQVSHQADQTVIRWIFWSLNPEPIHKFSMMRQQHRRDIQKQWQEILKATEEYTLI